MNDGYSASRCVEAEPERCMNGIFNLLNLFFGKTAVLRAGHRAPDQAHAGIDNIQFHKHNNNRIQDGIREA
jgi:hypothetical protein